MMLVRARARARIRAWTRAGANVKARVREGNRDGIVNRCFVFQNVVVGSSCVNRSSDVWMSLCDVTVFQTV